MRKNTLRHIVARLASVMMIAVALIMLGSAESKALPADRYASKSVLADGNWVKIRVADEGMQRLTYSQIKAMGFSDPSKVNVYGYGGLKISEFLTTDQVDDVPQVPVLRTSDAIYFYALGTVGWNYTPSNSDLDYKRSRNPYSSDSFYFLSDRDAADIAPDKAATTLVNSDNHIRQFTELVLHERELANLGGSGSEFYGEDMSVNHSLNVSLALPGMVAGTEAEMSIGYAMQCLSVRKGTSALTPGYLTVTTNGSFSQGTSRITFSGIEYKNKSSVYASHLDRYFKVGGLKDERLDVRLAIESAATINRARLDKISVAYQRHLDATGGNLVFRLVSTNPQSEVVELSGCSADMRIWDVTDAANPVEISYKLTSDKALFSPLEAGARKYVAFRIANVTASPVKSSGLANQNIHGKDAPDMLIITVPDYKNQAERIAEMHRKNDGMDVLVLTPEELFNEFSSGTPDVSAFRKALKMWYDRSGDDAVKYCLLFGRPSYDQRGLTEVVKRQPFPRLLTWESESSLTEDGSYCSDSFIAMLEDDEAPTATFNPVYKKINLAVGRMPVKSAAEAKSAVDKLINYVDNPKLGDWRNNVMLIADDADNAVHLNQSQLNYAGFRNNGTGVDFQYERLYTDAYPLGKTTSKSMPLARERMLKKFKEGVSMVNYIGHANPTSWTAEQLLTYSDIVGMSNTHLPIMLTYTCEFVRFDADEISGAEIMWLNPTAGAIAFVAANRPVQIYRNGTLSENLSKQYFRLDEEGKARRLGDIFRSAINLTTGDTNRFRYAIMGDPAMRVVNPQYRVVIDSFADADPSLITSASDYPVIPACGKVKVTGHVADGGGNPVSDFNGNIAAALYDAERVVETYGHNSIDAEDGVVSMYNDRKNRLFNGTFNVKNGKWEIELLLPFEIDNNYAPALLSLYAWDDKGRDANGSTDKFYIYGWDASMEDDVTDPQINVFALNTEGFRSGSIVNNSATVLAKVFDESGINMSTSGIGHQMTLTLDGRKVYTDVIDFYTPDSTDGRGGSLSYPLSDITEGQHTLMLTVWDNAGNSASKEIEFRVVENAVASIQSIATNATPAVTDVTFYINHNVPRAQAVRLDVYDISGRRIWTGESTDTSQITWNLTDNGGNRVGRGIYISRLTVTGDDSVECHATKKLAVAAQ